MKMTILFLCACCLLICCNNSGRQQKSVDDDASASSRDTLIALSAGWAIHFSEYDEKLELWYEPRLVDLNKKDTIRIKELSYENGSELFIKVSPDSNFFVLDNIIKGYLETDEDTILHENYTCVIIDIKNAIAVWGMQTDCSGEWDNESNWVSGDETVFNREDYMTQKKLESEVEASEP